MGDPDSFICVLVCRTDLDGMFLLYSHLSGRCSVLQLDRFSGQVLFEGSFESESAALAALAHHCFVERRRVYAVLGVLCSFQSLVLFVATKLRVATLPGGAKVSVLMQTDAIVLPLSLNNDTLFSREQLYNITSSLVASAYPLDELHFFASVDLTVPFGDDRKAPGVLNPAFVWNDFLRDSFVQEGLERFCPVLLQGFCSSKQLGPDLHVCMLAKRKNGSPEFEVDIVVWTSQQTASYTLRRSSVPDTTNKDALSGYFEELAERMRRNLGSPLFEPSLCLFSLSGQDDDTAAAVEATLSRSALAGSITMCKFDWAQATKRHSGKLEGVAGEAWNEIEKHVRLAGATLLDDDQLHIKQKGLLLLYSDDGLQSVSEFFVYFSLVVAAELVRLLGVHQEGAEEENEWAGLGMSASDVCSLLLPAKMSQVVAGFSVECSDAITFLLAHRESLFTLEVANLLPAAQAAPSSLRRRIAEYSQSLSEVDRMAQESNIALLRNSWVSKRICLGMISVAPGARRLSIPFLCLANVTHLALQFDCAVSSSMSISLSMVLDGKCVLDKLLVGVLLWPKNGTYFIKVKKKLCNLLFFFFFFMYIVISKNKNAVASNTVGCK